LVGFINWRLPVFYRHGRPTTEAMSTFVRHRKAMNLVVWLFQMVVVYGQEGYVRGKITNGTEHIAFVSVTIGEMTVFTDPSGEYAFTVIPGSYLMSVTHDDHETIQRNLIIVAGETQILDFVLYPINQLGEVVLLGSRSNVQRSNLNTAVPVDAFSQKVLQQSGQISLTQMLNFIAPSLNVSGETLNEPIALRGLDPDHVLILLNGTRYHNMAWINSGGVKNQIGRGSVGNDLNSIPPSSIEKIEVLRDGASAQYGSDAIAGVINIVLKETTDKTQANVQTGQFYEGDGEKYAFGINHGITLNQKENKGFLNLSADFKYQAPTHRGGQYDGTVYFPIRDDLDQDQKDAILLADNQKVEESGFNRKKVGDQVGNSKFVVAGLLANGAYPVSDKMDVFWTAAFNSRITRRENAYRFPKNVRQVNLELYPDGFQPLTKPTTTDITLITGVKEKLKDNWHWELISSVGANTLKSEASKTKNASQSYLGKEAQTQFYNGKRIYEQLTNNFNVSKKYTNLPKAINLLNLSTGLEWRLERYFEKPGEEASWKNYDNTYRKQPGAGGISPEEVINKDRNNIGVFVDFEMELHNRFLLNAASRFEYYSDFGANLAGKLAARYKLTDKLVLRASMSNGFRAPSLQQRHTSSVSVTRQNLGGVLVILERGIFPNDHPLIKALGVPPLSAEKSFNLSSGFTINMAKKLSLTTDAYWLQLRDRIVLSGMFYRSSNVTLDNILSQYPEFNQVEQVAFFANAINTSTKGMDIVFQGNLFGNTSPLGFMLAANFTQTRLYGRIKVADNLPNDELNTSSLLNTEEKVRIEKSQPSSKIILALNYETGKMGFNLSNTRFGKTVIAPLIDASQGIYRPETFSSKIITDIKINFKVNSCVTIGAGANNLFNVYPDKIKNYENSAEGMRIYSPEGAPFGFSGGYYYFNSRFKF